MRRTVITLILASAFATATAAACAQQYPGPGRHYRGRPYGLYGQLYNPYFGSRHRSIDPRVCHPGLCQDDPHY